MCDYINYLSLFFYWKFSEIFNNDIKNCLEILNFLKLIRKYIFENILQNFEIYDKFHFKFKKSKENIQQS